MSSYDLYNNFKIYIIGNVYWGKIFSQKLSRIIKKIQNNFIFAMWYSKYNIFISKM